MSGAVQMLMAGGGADAYSTWNPSDKDADISLSGGNLVASITAAAGSLRGTRGRDPAGNFYFEITVGGATNHLVGVGSTSASLANYPGVDANARAYYSVTGEKYTSNAGAAYGATYTVGDVIGVHMNNGVLTFYKNGSSQGSAYTDLVGAASLFYPMWGPGTAGAGTRTGTLNVGASAFTGSLPSGAAPWG